MPTPTSRSAGTALSQRAAPAGGSPSTGLTLATVLLIAFSLAGQGVTRAGTANNVIRQLGGALGGEIPWTVKFFS